MSIILIIILINVILSFYFILKFILNSKENWNQIPNDTIIHEECKCMKKKDLVSLFNSYTEMRKYFTEINVNIKLTDQTAPYFFTYLIDCNKKNNINGLKIF
jgi:hypothetical protein